VALSEQGKQTEAEAAFGKIASDAPQGYRILARFRAADAQAQANPAAAAKAYEALAADSTIGATWRDLAAVRAGLLTVDSASLADMRQKFEPLTEPGRSFRHTAREILAFSAWRNKDAAAARRYIDMIAADGETPPGTRARIDVLSALVAASGKS
jgi:hypothetical protein